MEALELTPASTVDVDDTLRAELIEGRNLHEHWKEQMPVFDVNPRPKEPVKSGKSFAARNPEATPFKAHVEQLDGSTPSTERLRPGAPPTPR